MLAARLTWGHVTVFSGGPSFFFFFSRTFLERCVVGQERGRKLQGMVGGDALDGKGGCGSHPELGSIFNLANLVMDLVLHKCDDAARKLVRRPFPRYLSDQHVPNCWSAPREKQSWLCHAAQNPPFHLYRLVLITSVWSDCVSFKVTTGLAFVKKWTRAVLLIAFM